MNELSIIIFAWSSIEQYHARVIDYAPSIMLEDRQRQDMSNINQSTMCFVKSHSGLKYSCNEVISDMRKCGITYFWYSIIVTHERFKLDYIFSKLIGTGDSSQDIWCYISVTVWGTYSKRLLGLNSVQAQSWTDISCLIAQLFIYALRSPKPTIFVQSLASTTKIICSFISSHHF